LEDEMRELQEWERLMYAQAWHGYYEVVEVGYMKHGVYVPPVRRWVPRKIAV
jgi:hypothetical protein